MGLLVELIYILVDAVLDRAAGGRQSEVEAIRTAASRNRTAMKHRKD